MEIDYRKIKGVLDLCQHLRETYFIYFHNGKEYISVNDLLNIVINNYEKKVTLSILDEPHTEHSMYSFVYVYEDESYEICLLSGLTNCWQRFSLCKELFHVVLDEEEHRNPDLASHLSDFRQSVREYHIPGSNSSCMEILTEFAAMQFLFPYARRLEVVEEVKSRLTTGELAKSIYEDIAIRFRIPRLLIEEYLSAERLEFFDALSWIDKDDKR